MSETTRDILNRVASGELTPEAAATLLAALNTGETAAGTGAPKSEPLPVKRLAIRARAVRLVVHADPSVDTAIAEGPHRISHEGEALVVHSDLSAGEYTAEAPRSMFTTWLQNMNRAGETLTVRVNPDLPLEVLNIAGSLELTGVHGGASIGVEAGSAKLLGGSGPLNLNVASGSADVEWRFTGESLVNTDLGSARVSVLPGSDVSITAEAALGQSSIRMANGTTIKATGKGTAPQAPVVVGDGAGRLKVTSRLGSSVVSVS
jgi:hypothetical protein